jgi:hypothetical protein
MKRTWHLVTFDLRRFWKQTLFVLIVQATAMFVYSHQQTSHEGGDIFDLQRSIGLIYILPFALWASLVASIGQNDPAFDATAFWPTRPITAPQLTTARIITSLMLAMVMPTIVYFIAQLMRGFSVGDALDSLVIIIRIQVIFIPSFLLLAALTQKFLHFWFVLFILLILWVLTTPYLSQFYARRSHPEHSSQGWIMFLLTAVGSVTILQQVFASRSPLKGFILTVLLGLLILSIPFWWQWEISFP